MKRPQRVYDGPPCIAAPEHGSMLAIRGVEGWLCVHSEHNGRPASHPLGKAPETRRQWSMAEVEAGRG